MNQEIAHCGVTGLLDSGSRTASLDSYSWVNPTEPPRPPGRSRVSQGMAGGQLEPEGCAEEVPTCCCPLTWPPPSQTGLPPVTTEEARISFTPKKARVPGCQDDVSTGKDGREREGKCPPPTHAVSHWTSHRTRER